MTTPTQSPPDMADAAETADLPDLRPRAAAAMLAAAYGDALGWPVEPRGARVGGTKDIRPKLDFISWRRREGGRFAPHERHVPAGTYSDDTQLMLAVGRSLSTGPDWWRHYTEVELPLWAIYELGGGGAVKRSANSWARRIRPWSPNARARDRRRYFDAGANGVVMRVLPHSIYGARGPFSQVAETVMADGITTHGHPRALVSALALAFAQWRALRRHSTLGYGELVDETIAGAEEWAKLPLLDGYASDWASSADEMFPSDYTRVWDRTVDEMLGLLETCRVWLRKGSLARDLDALEDLGALGRENGSGTRTAAAALYFAGRYAARPPAGLLAAAFARRTDTDTVACVTGSLLGAQTGLDWLLGPADDLLDAHYISQVGTALALRQPTVLTPDSWTPNLRRKLLDHLARKDAGARLMLPVFGRATVLRVEEPQTRSGNSISIWWLRTEIGQTLAMTKVSRVGAVRERNHEQTSISEEMLLEQTDRRHQRREREAPDPPAQPPSAFEHQQDEQAADPDARFSFLVRVSNLDRTVEIYHDVLKLPLGRRTDHLAVFGRNLAFLREDPAGLGRFVATPRPGDPRAFDSPQILGLVLPHAHARAAHRWLVNNDFFVSELVREHEEGRFQFRFLDPDGHVVEVLSR